MADFYKTDKDGYATVFEQKNNKSNNELKIFKRIYHDMINIYGCRDVKFENNGTIKIKRKFSEYQDLIVESEEQIQKRRDHRKKNERTRTVNKK